MIFETHAHYDDEQYNEDRDLLLESLPSQGVGYVVNVGASIQTSKNTIALTERFAHVYGAIGVHPNEVEELNEEHLNWLREMADKPKIVAIGEIGLDYYWKEPAREIQKIWFERQMDLSREVSLPMIIHSRDAAKDTIEMMKAQKAGEIGGVIHCYSYSTESAREFLDMGFYLGIGGVLTFSNAKKLKEVAEYVPLDRIVLETDCPYLAPVPYRGKRNSSLYIPYVVKELARIKGAGIDEIEEITTRNAKELYRIK